MKKLYVMPIGRAPALAAVQEATDGQVVTVSDQIRTLPQNAMFHDLCGAIAKAGAKWAGKPRTAKEWKVLLVSGHATATGEGSDIVPGLEGEFVNIRESTALMSKKRGSSLIDYTMAYCANNGIAIPAHEVEA